jgi:hypothetical protein
MFLVPLVASWLKSFVIVPLSGYTRCSRGLQNGPEFRKCWRLCSLSKLNKKESTFIDDPLRCEVCNTSLTLYPKDFAPCPHCQRKICRQCWGGSWPSKAFAAESCSHAGTNDGLTLNPVEESNRGFRMDWPRAILILGLVALAVGIIYIVLNLFVF